MDLTTLDRVKLHLGKTDTTDDVFLGRLITSYSIEFERFLKREVENTQRTETYRLKNCKERVCLRAYPVESVSVVRIAGTKSDLSAASPLLSSDFDYDPDNGIFELLKSSAYSPLYVRVTYTGGMADDTTAFIAAYPDIANAVDLQVAYHWKRRNDAGQSSVTDFNSEMSFSHKELAILASVRRILIGYKSFSV